jgi:hypothetical protein
MSEATKKNFRVIQDVLNAQAKGLRDMQDRITLLEGTVATLRAEIATANQLSAHLFGRGMGSTVHK